MNITFGRMRQRLAPISVLGLTIAGMPISATAATSPRGPTFAPPVRYGVASNGTAFDVASGDFSGTHIKDIVVAAGTGNAVCLLRGRGDGSFAPATTVYTTAGRSVTAIATGDFNGDGHLDLAIVTESAQEQDVVLLLGDGHRHFKKSATGALPFLNLTAPTGQGGIRSIAVGSFDHTGSADVAVTDSVNYVSVFAGDGHGALGRRQDLLTAAFPASLVIADLDGDGLADIGAIDNDSASVYSLIGRGNDTFFPRRRISLGPLPVNAVPLSLASGDLRRSGNTDLFVLLSETGYPNCCSLGKVLLSDGHGVYGRPTDVPFKGSSAFLPKAAALGDFNGDAIPDIAAVGYLVPNNQVVFLPGIGDGTFSTAGQTVITLSSGSNYLQPSRIVVDDFNGDGRPDVAVALYGTNGFGIDVLLNTTPKEATTPQ